MRLQRLLWLVVGAGLLAGGLSACALLGGDPPPTPTPAPVAEAEPTPEPTREPTREPTPEPAPQPTEAPTQTPVPTPDPNRIELVAVTFAQDLTSNFLPVEPGNTFRPTQTVYLSVHIAGRPTEGTVSAEYYFRDEQLLRTDYDLNDVNGERLFTLGEDTFIGYTLSPGQALPISDNYRADILVNDQVIDSYFFTILPPAGAISSAVASATLAAATDQANNPLDERTTFEPNETVFLVGRGDFGTGSLLRAEWYAEGQLIPEGSRSLEMTENITDTGFYFNFLPEGGWATGAYEAVLTLNDDEVGRYPFTIAPPSPLPDPQLRNLFANTQRFEFATGLFHIDIPQGWQLSDSSTPDLVSLTWTASGSNVLVNVNITKRQLLESDLAQVLQEELTRTFGNQPDFQLSNPQPQPDGSVLVGFKARTDNTNPVLMRGTAYAEQRGDTFSVLVLIGPDAQFDALWEAGFNTIANSYTIDPTAPLVPPAAGDVFASLQPYAFPTGLFTIDVPEGWQVTDSSSRELVNVSWTAPGSPLSIRATLVEQQTRPDELPLILQRDLATSYGSRPDFQLSNPQPQPDGSILVAFTVRASDEPAAPLVRGNAYAEQRGNKLSILTLVGPDDRFADLWNGGFRDIANSYTINPDASLAP